MKSEGNVNNVVIGKGSMGSKGVVAARDFKKGEIVLKLNLTPITFKELKALSPEEYQSTHNHNGQIFVYGKPERYVNHSETPNVVFDVNQQANVALQYISAGELITVDSYYDDIPVFKRINAVLVKVPTIQEGLDFYREQLGLQTFWKKADMASVHLGEGQLVMSTTLDPETSILVDSVEYAADVFVRAGGKVVSPPEDVDAGSLVIVEDAFGNRFTLVDFSKGFYKIDGSRNVVAIE